MSEILKYALGTFLTGGAIMFAGLYIHDNYYGNKEVPKNAEKKSTTEKDAQGETSDHSTESEADKKTLQSNEKTAKEKPAKEKQTFGGMKKGFLL